MKNFALRPLTLADYDEAYALWQRTEGMGLGASDTREAIAFFLDRNPGLSLVACDATGRLIGTVLCGHDGRRGYLHHLAVEKTSRKQGIGRALVDACLNRLAALKIAKCNLFIFADNTEGRTFWTHQGWTTREDIVLVQTEINPERKKICGCDC
ncbi:MAG: GNAT family N-acetyltransferase [Nibricoccus sp.]